MLCKMSVFFNNMMQSNQKHVVRHDICLCCLLKLNHAPCSEVLQRYVCIKLLNNKVRFSCLQLKFHWDQFPPNFPVANVTGKSPTSYEEVGRVASLLRGSYEEAGDFQTISTCQDGLETLPTSS